MQALVVLAMEVYLYDRRRNLLRDLGVLFIDLNKAFDTLNHEVLLHNLLSFGICNNSFKWFRSYLRGRTQSVRWKGVLSDEKDVTIGVPQGSILGPLFFILFVNDYPKCLKHANVNIYADDTTQDVPHKSINFIEQKLYGDLIYSVDRMNSNKLIMNLEKTQCMLIGTKHKLSKGKILYIKVGDVVLNTVEKAKLLGVTIDESLTWLEHIDFLSKKLAKKNRYFTSSSCFYVECCFIKKFIIPLFSHILTTVVQFGVQPKIMAKLRKFLNYRKGQLELY